MSGVQGIQRVKQLAMVMRAASSIDFALWRRVAVACLVVSLVVVSPSQASDDEPPAAASRFRLWHDLGDVFTLVWGGARTAFAAPSLLYLLPSAATIAGASLADDDVKAVFDRNDEDDALAHAGNVYARVFFGPAQVGLYMVGEFTQNPKLSWTGKKLMAAVLGTAAMIQPLKTLTRRRRPDGSDRRSFPSFDAGMVSSMIPTLYADYGVVPGTMAALSAAFIGVARIYGNKHYLSDVLTSYAIGIGWGLLVETYHHRQSSWALMPMGDGRTTVGLAIHLRL